MNKKTVDSELKKIQLKVITDAVNAFARGCSFVSVVFTHNSNSRKWGTVEVKETPEYETENVIRLNPVASIDSLKLKTWEWLYGLPILAHNGKSFIDNDGNPLESR